MWIKTPTACALLAVQVQAMAHNAIGRQEGLQHLDFLVVGDVGLAGNQQNTVAQGMADWSTRVSAQFTLNLGDNFYESGVSSKTDRLWDTGWRLPFSAPSLNHTWYSILGNHDYVKNPKAQVYTCHIAE
jgi:hypothetical protein